MDINKTTFKKPATIVAPIPAVMVTCGDFSSQYNIITIAWTGTVNSEPPMAYISVRESRYSYQMIKEQGEFVINLTTEDLAAATDFCGVKSGRDFDKFKETGLTPAPASMVKCPMIAESPVNIECRVIDIHKYPSHHMFVAEVLAVHVDSALFQDSGKLEMEKAGMLCYNHGFYFGMKQEPIGKFGFSVMKPKTKKRLEQQEKSEQISRKVSEKKRNRPRSESKSKSKRK